MEEKFMDKTKLAAALTYVVPELITIIGKERGLDSIASAELLYESRLYKVLENPDTGLWRLSPLTLFGLLNEELTTGKITFPEEQ